MTRLSLSLGESGLPGAFFSSKPTVCRGSGKTDTAMAPHRPFRPKGKTASRAVMGAQGGGCWCPLQCSCQSHLHPYGALATSESPSASARPATSQLLLSLGRDTSEPVGRGLARVAGGHRLGAGGPSDRAVSPQRWERLQSTVTLALRVSPSVSPTDQV